MENLDSSEYLYKVLTEFEDTLIKIIDPLYEKLNTSKPPDSIYHYTNDSGLHGILESGKLRLTNIFSLNDPSELSHGLSHAVNILNRETTNGSTVAKEFAENFSKFCQDGIKHSAYYFVCSFSSNEHDLGQWRAYADNGRGYALEFDANTLASDFASKANGNNTFPVTYDDDDIVEIHAKLIAATVPLISLPFNNPSKGFSTQGYLKHLASILSLYALQAALYFKHKAYEKESEFRFLQIFGRDEPMPDVKWRARSNELVAYREFDWGGLQPRVLKRIIIGPAAEREKATRFIKECLAAYYPRNQGDVEISYSGIPYRAISS